MTAVRNPKPDVDFRPVRREPLEPLTFPSAKAFGLMLRKAVKRVASDRKGRGVELAPTRNWLRAGAYISAHLDDSVSVETVSIRLDEIGFPLETAHRTDALQICWETAAAAKAGLLTRSPRIFGELISLTKDERERLRIRCIDAVDEPAADRRRRLKAESEARRRQKSGAKQRQHSKEAEKPWQAEGISRRTWYRRQSVALIRGSTFLYKEGCDHETVPTDKKFHETVPNSGDRDAA